MHEIKITTTPDHIPWNKAKLVGQKPPFNLPEVWTVRSKLTEQTREAVAARIAEANLAAEDYLLPAGQRDSAHLSTRQYARIVKRWIVLAGGDRQEYGTHSLRRTKATLIYRRTKNLRAVQLLLGHRKRESTVR